MFGEKVKGYEVSVLNEREVRAGAGILFLFAMIVFMNALLIKNFTPLKLFVTAFLIDFIVRLLINPKYSPSLIIGRFFVQNQTVEYAGAPQKKFAWFLGLGLAALMFVLVVIFDVRGWINLGVCLFCLTLLFSEAAFGICVGCKMYNWFNKEKAKLCPGGACEVKIKQPIQKINKIQLIYLIGFIAIMIIVTNLII